MRTSVTIAILVLSAQVVRAERSAAFNLGGMIGGAEQRVDEATKMKPAGGARLSLSFEHPPPVKDSAVDVTLVPELVAAAVLNTDRGEAMIGVGARGEIRLSHLARMAFYVAGRALIVGANTDPAGELGLGEYIYLWDRLRLGGEATVMLRRTDMFEDPSRSQHVIMAHVYLGWAM
ncbi:MAG: hypothetical protein H0T46_06670 [Deltaproteobacteria bacterium]|nr:hypothetical protein [Deltaproteobacteria bacterium]